MRKIMAAGSRAALFLAVLCLGLRTAQAVEIQFPVKIGDSQTRVKEVMGEPEETGAWEYHKQTRLFYKSRGIEIQIDQKTDKVDMIDFHGEYRLPDWGMYPDPIIAGLGMNSTFDDAVRALGSDYQNSDLDEGSDFRMYFWNASPDYELQIEFWEKDYKDEDTGKVMPKGSIYHLKFYKKTPLTADQRIEEGRYYYENGDYAKALVEYDLALTLEPGRIVAHFARGMAYHAMHDYPKAVEALNKAIEIDGSMFEPHFELGMVYMGQKNYDESILSYTRAIEIREDAEAYYNRGYSHLKAGHETESAADYSKAVELNPGLAGKPGQPPYANIPNQVP